MRERVSVWLLADRRSSRSQVALLKNETNGNETKSAIVHVSCIQHPIACAAYNT